MNLTGIRSLFPATLAVLAFNHPAPAQTAADAGPTPRRVIVEDRSVEAELPALESTTATRLPERILDAPRSVQVITRRTFEDRIINDPQEAVQNVSGVARGGNFNGVGESFVLRGFLQQDLIKDGFRAGALVGSGSPVFGATGATDVSNLERIEVLKGPAAILYGRGEPGGVVNYVTRTPYLGNGFTLEQQIGSYGFYRTTLDANWQPFDPVALRLDAAYDRNESAVDLVRGERFFIAPSFLWRIGSATTLTFRGEYSNDDRSTNPGVPYDADARRVLPGVPSNRYFGEPDFTNFRTRQLRGLLTLEHRWNEHNVTTLSLHARRGDIDGGYFILFNFAGPFIDPVTGDVGRSAAQQDTAEQNQAVRLDHVFTWTVYDGGSTTSGKDGKSLGRGGFPTVTNQLLFSAEFERQSNDTLRQLSGHTPLNPFNPIYTGYAPQPLLPFPGFPTLLRENSAATAKSYSLLVQDRLSFGETVYLSFGGRAEWFDAASATSYPAGSVFPSSANEVHRFTFNPSAGLVVKPTRNLSLYGSYAESTNTFQNFGLRTADGKAIDPERSRQFEAGVKAELFNRRLLATASFFQITKTDVAGADPNNPLFSVNAGEERSRGFEFDLSGEPIPGWRVNLNYAYIDARIVSAPLGLNVGNRRYGVPENSGGFFTTYEFQSGALKGLGLGGGMFFADRTQVDNTNSGRLSGWAQTDAVIYYRRGRWKAQVNAKNLFDNEFYYAQNQDTTVQIAPARTIIGSLSVKF